MSYLGSLIRRYPLITFFVLAFVLSWWPWILYSYDLVPNPIVGFGPFLAAMVVLASMHNCINTEVRFRALLADGGAERLELSRT